MIERALGPSLLQPPASSFVMSCVHSFSRPSLHTLAQPCGAFGDKAVPQTRPCPHGSQQGMSE